MAVTTILAVGRTAATSTAVTVPSGSTVVLSLTSTDGVPNEKLAVKLTTSNDPITIGFLDADTPSALVEAPSGSDIEVVVVRPLIADSAPAVGVDKITS